MAKRTTVSNAATSVATLSGTDATQQGDVNTISTVDTSTPSGENKPDGANSQPSQGVAEGAGANAGSNTLEMSLSEILEKTGTVSLEQLLGYVRIGMDLVEEVKAVSRDYPDLLLWRGSENPAGIVSDLARANGLLRDARREERASDKAERWFTITKAVRLNNELLEADDFIPLSFDQHKEAVAAGACDPDWEKGE